MGLKIFTGQLRTLDHLSPYLYRTTNYGTAVGVILGECAVLCASASDITVSVARNSASSVQVPAEILGLEIGYAKRVSRVEIK
jgi:hypothetical protein